MAGPSPLTRVEVGENLGAMTAAGGDVWVNDFGREELLRVERPQRAGGRAAGARAAGRAGRGRRERVGAALGRAVLPHAERAAVPDRRPHGADHAALPLDPEQIYFGVLAGAGAVWVWGPRHVVRIDPASGSILADFGSTRESGDLTGAVLEGDGLLVSTVDGHLLRIDAQRRARPGRRGPRSSARSCWPSTGAGRSPPRRRRARGRRADGPAAVAPAARLPGLDGPPPRGHPARPRRRVPRPRRPRLGDRHRHGPGARRRGRCPLRHHEHALGGRRAVVRDLGGRG